jgi:hypothetical protein
MKNKTIRSLFLCLLISSFAAAQTSTTSGSTTTKKSSTTTQSTRPRRATTPVRTAAQSVQDTIRTITIPAGTPVTIRVNENLTSETAQSGDRFTGVTTEDITVNGTTVFPRGSDVTGRVMNAKPSGRLSDSGTLELRLQTIRSGDNAAALSTESFLVQGQSHTKSNTTKIGGGAAIGAVIGAIAGGGKGAAIGTVVGGAAGTGAAAATGKQEAKVESEAVLKFVTSADATIGQASQIMQQADREPVLQTRSDSDTTTSQNTTNSSYPNSNTSQNTTTNTNSYPNTSSNTQTGSNTNTQTTTSTSTNTNVNTNTLFSAYERRAIRSCVADNAASLPLEARNRGQLTSSQAQQVVRGGTLPADWVKRVRTLPYACEKQLPQLTGDQERVIYSGRVMLIDGNNHIYDVFDLEQ